jgi:hypothetical protein
MHIEKPYCQTILHNSDVFVGGYPVTKHILNDTLKQEGGGAARLEGLVVPIGLVVGGYHNQTHNYKVKNENIHVIDDDIFTNLMENVTLKRKSNATTKKNSKKSNNTTRK